MGPGAVIGTEMLAAGVTSLYTIKTGADSLLWVLQREAYQQYLTVRVALWPKEQIDPVQVESAKQYDQRMYHWVNQSQLPLRESKPGLLKLVADMFDAETVEANEVVWDPAQRTKLFRVLVMGKAAVGAEAKKGVSDNEFDVDVESGVRLWE